MTIEEYKQKFLELYEQIEKEYGTKAEVHIYEENDATYGRFVTRIDITF